MPYTDLIRREIKGGETDMPAALIPTVAKQCALFLDAARSIAVESAFKPRVIESSKEKLADARVFLQKAAKSKGMEKAWRMYCHVQSLCTFREIMCGLSLDTAGVMRAYVTDDDEMAQLFGRLLLRLEWLQPQGNGDSFIVFPAAQLIKIAQECSEKERSVWVDRVKCMMCVPREARDIMGATPYPFAHPESRDLIGQGVLGRAYAWPAGTAKPLGNPEDPSNFVIKTQPYPGAINELMFESALRASGSQSPYVVRINRMYVDLRPQIFDEEKEKGMIKAYTIMPRAHTTLEKWLNAEFRSIGAATALRLIRSMMMGLSVVRSHGFVHGDLHAGNFLVSDASASLVLIADFGMAHMMSQPWVDYDAVCVCNVINQILHKVEKSDRKNLQLLAVRRVMVPSDILVEFRAGHQGDRLLFDPALYTERKKKAEVKPPKQKVLQKRAYKYNMLRRALKFALNTVGIADERIVPNEISTVWERYVFSLVDVQPPTELGAEVLKFAYPYYNYGGVEDYPVDYTLPVLPEDVEETAARSAAASAAASAAVKRDAEDAELVAKRVKMEKAKEEEEEKVSSGGFVAETPKTASASSSSSVPTRPDNPSLPEGEEEEEEEEESPPQ